MSYWPQQLNFTVWCATTGCGISRELFDSKNTLLNLPPSPSHQVRVFFLFHVKVYFTIRRILYKMGGVQNIAVLSDDPTLKNIDNHYDVASNKRLCRDFGIDPKSDFRFNDGPNHGLGRVYIYVSYSGPEATAFKYPGEDSKFSDESGSAEKENLICYIENGGNAASQFDFFTPNTSSGLTQAGLSRLNQSIEAFVYCMLGVQVNVRSSILGDGGRSHAQRARKHYHA